MNNKVELFLNSLNEYEQRLALDLLRQRLPLHQLEIDWNIRAEFILEAISRSQDITKRGVRGIIAELAFSTYVLNPLKPNWSEVPIIGDQPYDSLIRDQYGDIKIQTKNQRLVKGIPLHPNGACVKNFPHVQGWYVAETQKTRSGKVKPTDLEDGTEAEVEEASTRPYRFGEFDILSVCLHPSTGDWTRFMFTPASTLIPSAKNPALMATLQPVPPTSMYAWTDDLRQCIGWVRNPSTMPLSPGPQRQAAQLF
jgi:hypothetical protein